MPVHKVKLPDGSTGYQWGRTGKIYKDPRKAYAQGAAIEHSGWKQKKAQYSIQQPVLVSKLPKQKREAVAKLIQGLQRDMPTVTPIQWKRTTVQRILQRLDKDQQQAAIAYHKGQPVAAATGGIDQKSSQAFFNNLYVDQKHRGKGLARRLLQKLEQRAASAGIQRAFLHVTANNPARRLYRQLGYMPQSLALYKQLQKQNDGMSQQHRMLQQVAQTAQTAGLPIFAVTQGASITRNNGSVGDNLDQDWSSQKKAALDRQQLQQIARPYYTDDKWQHIQDVYRDAQVIKGKQLTPTQAASIIFHDTAKRDMGTAGHAANGAAIAQRQLKQHFPAKQLALICQAIKQHNPAQRIDLDTMKSRIKQFSSPEAQLLAISDDLFPDPSSIQDRALSYMKRRDIQNTPQNLIRTIRKVYYPGTRMPQLKHYKRQFQLANLPLQAYIDNLHN